MQREPAHHNIERSIFERKIFRIGGTERNVRNAALPRAFLGDPQHGVSEVDADNFSRRTSESFRDVSRTRRDIQYALVTDEMCGGDQAPDAFFVGHPRIRRKGMSLRRKRFSNDVVMLRHGKSLARRPPRKPVATAQMMAGRC